MCSLPCCVALPKKLATFCVLVAACALTPVFAFELWFRWALRDVTLDLRSRGSPPLLKSAVWLAHGERPGAGVRRVWFGSVVDVLLGGAQPPGFCAADRVALDELRSPRLRSGPTRFAAGVWLTRRTNEDALASALVDHSYFGRSAWGAEAAARAFFDKPAGQLSVAEVALLAAQLRGPHEDPYCREDTALRGRGFMLSRLRESGLIPEEDEVLGRQAPLRLRPIDCSELRSSRR